MRDLHGRGQNHNSPSLLGFIIFGLPVLSLMALWIYEEPYIGFLLLGILWFLGFAGWCGSLFR